MALARENATGNLTTPKNAPESWIMPPVTTAVDVLSGICNWPELKSTATFQRSIKKSEYAGLRIAFLRVSDELSCGQRDVHVGFKQVPVRADVY